MTAALLAQLNAFRTREGLTELKSWKSSRNQPQLDAYIAEAQRAAAELAAQVAADTAAKAKAPKPITKKARVLDLLTAKGGTTIAAIAAALDISETAARSLIGDLRRDGAVIKTAKGEGNSVVYSA